MLLDRFEVVADDDLDAGEGLAVLDADRHGRLRDLLRLVDDRRNLAVVDDVDVAARIDDLGRADADLLHRAAPVVDDDDVPHLELPFEHHEDARDDVRDKALCAEADDERQNTCGGKERCRIHAPRMQHHHDSDDGNEPAHEAFEKFDDGDRAVAVSKAFVHDKTQEHGKEHRDGDDLLAADERGDLMIEHVDKVIVAHCLDVFYKYQELYHLID